MSNSPVSSVRPQTGSSHLRDYSQHFHNTTDEGGKLDGFSHSLRKCVLLLSGGLDSVNMIPLLVAEGMEVYPIFCDYGQESQEAEFASAQYYSQLLHTKPLKITKLRLWENDSYGLLKSRRTENSLNFFLPYRNLALATAGAAYADSVSAGLLAFGFHADSGYSDAKPPFLDLLDQILSLSGSPEGKLRLWKAALPLAKSDLLRLSLSQNVPLNSTYSCYSSTRCLDCPSCSDVSAAFAALASEYDPAFLDSNNPNHILTVDRYSELSHHGN